MDEMKDEQKLTTKGKRIYFVEFLRVFLILSIVLVHIGGRIDRELGASIRMLFHTNTWVPQFAVECFFIIGGFFLYKTVDENKFTKVSTHIGNLWLRLMPGIIFFYVILICIGSQEWWNFPFCLFPAEGYGLPGQLVGYGDWFVGVYFIASCFFIALFSQNRESAWRWVCVIMILCWCLQMNSKPQKGYGVGGMFFGLLALGTVRGFSCMALGLVAASLSKQWIYLRRTLPLRLFSTMMEAVGLFMLFSYMYRTSLVHYRPIAVELIFAVVLVSASHSWGYITSFLNRISGITYLSRYTYSILLAHSVPCHYFYDNHNLGMNPHSCSLIIAGAIIPLVFLEYHFVEKWLVPKLKLFFVKESTAS